MAQQQQFRMDSWFSRICDRKGEDYILSGKITTDEVNKNAERIIDDIIRGKVDYNKYGQMVMQPVILDILINYCSSQLSHKMAILFALNYVNIDYANNKILHYSTIAPFQLQAYVQNENGTDMTVYPAAINESTALNIAQAIGEYANEISMLEMVKHALVNVSISGNIYELYTLVNKLAPYVRAKNNKRF